MYDKFNCWLCACVTKEFSRVEWKGVSLEELWYAPRWQVLGETRAEIKYREPYLRFWKKKKSGFDVCLMAKRVPQLQLVMDYNSEAIIKTVVRDLICGSSVDGCVARTLRSAWILPSPSTKYWMDFFLKVVLYQCAEMWVISWFSFRCSHAWNDFSTTIDLFGK